MPEVIGRFGIIKQYAAQDPIMIVLHDTAGPSVVSAENTFKSERPGLGYHFMIARDGGIFQYAPITNSVGHALHFNFRTIGISFAGGGKFGPVTDAQIDAVIDLINYNIKPNSPNLRFITGHKHCSPRRKIDPRFNGEPAHKVDLVIDRTYMEQIASATKLQFLDKDHVQGYLKK